MFGARAALLLVLSGGPWSAGASEPVARVQAWLDSWSSLSGRFEQRLASPTLPSDQVESGSFQIARPDRMRWEFSEPERKLAVTDGVSTWLYIPGDRQVIRGSLDQLRRDGAVSLLLSGSLRLQEAFVVRTAVVRDKEVSLDLLPREPSGAVAEIQLRADARSGQVLGFEVVDESGNRVTWTLRDLLLDPQLEEDLFSFRIPRGVEVQEVP